MNRYCHIDSTAFRQVRARGISLLRGSGSCFVTIAMCVFFVSCGTGDDRPGLVGGECAHLQGAGILRLDFRCTDPSDAYFRSFGRSVEGIAASKENFKITMDHGILRSKIGPRIAMEESTGALVPEASAKTSLWFQRRLVGTHDVYADDVVGWSCALAWDGEADSLLGDIGRSSLTLSLVYDGSSPPHARLFVSRFDDVQARSEADGTIAIRGSFRVVGSDAAFPAGRGVVLAIIPINVR